MKLLKSGTDPRRCGGSLYFSYGGDATLTQQRYEAVHADPQAAGLAPWQRAAPSFFWNRALAQPLLGKDCSSLGAGSRAGAFTCCSGMRPAAAEASMHRFVPTAFQGFAGQISDVRLAGAARAHAATIILIARRSVKRAGCRQWRRGADLEGAVANFVESEQLVVVDGGAVTAAFVQVGRRGRGSCHAAVRLQCPGCAACPFRRATLCMAMATQVRGSIPLLWSQTPCLKYKIPIRIAPHSRSQPVFAGHARNLIRRYKVSNAAAWVQQPSGVFCTCGPLLFCGAFLV